MRTAPARLSHVFPLGTEIGPGGRLVLGGCDSVELARELGTPLYVLVEEDLRARAGEYVGAFAAAGHDDADVLFASKALPVAAVCRLFAEEGLGADVASGGELAIALRGGVDPSRIALHGNAKPDRELADACAAGIGLVVVDARDEIARVEAAAAAAGGAQHVLLRVTPDVAGDTHAAISTGQADSKFGVSLAEAPAAIEELRAAPHLSLEGLHVHVGSMLQPETLRAAVAALAPLGEFGTYDLGGGLGVAYTSGERDGSIADHVSSIVAAVEAEIGPGRRILLEPGRALVARAGVTLYTFESVKRNVSTWVAVDGGMSDNPRPLMYDARYEAVIADRPLAEPSERCRVTGKHCESGDVLVDAAPLPGPRRGDVLATPVTGAYGHALASNYNGALRPAVALVRDGEARVVVRRETVDDLLARELA